MIQVKICGITNLEDAKAALEYGADALGFVFYKKSKRYISPGQVETIIKQLPPFINTVGVFVNSGYEEIEYTVKTSGIKMIQLSGDEASPFVNSLPYSKIKVLHIDENYIFNHEDVDKYKNVKLLLDSSVSFGGSGVTANWDICRKIAKQHPVILAGGLTPENVTDAIAYVKPVAVDVSSGVEINAKKKDINKIKEFISTVKRY